MDINNKARIHWACRRGMRELDISIMPFFEHEYDTLSDDEKRIFIRLLARTVAITPSAWAGGRGYSINAMAAELHAAVVDTAFAGGI